MNQPLNEIQQIEQTIAVLENQRSILGDAVVDTALAPLRERLAALQPFTLAEQRKVVTVLFADLAGFTTMAEKMDPEDVREVVNAYFARWTATIEQFGGRVEKFIGDAVMAVFGVNQSREDDPENAVRAALGMRQALDALNRELKDSRGLRLSMRTGVHTGPVVVSLLPERKGQDFIVVGDTVNTASRLQSAAPLDGILISHDTYRLVRGIFTVQALEPITVKGKSEPIQVYTVLLAKPRSFHLSLRGVEGIETTLVGRQAELKRLQDTQLQVTAAHRCQVITLTGEAGLGKTRLVSELEQWLDLLPQTIYLFRGRSAPAFQNLPHALVRDVVSYRFQIQDSDNRTAVLQKIQKGLEMAPAAENVDYALRASFIGQYLGFDFADNPQVHSVQHDGHEIRARAMSYLRDFFGSLAQVNPVVIILEDIQWADDASLDILWTMAGGLQNSSLLIITTARPALFDRRPTWGENQPFHQRMDLSPLERADSLHLVDEILQKAQRVPAELRELVVDNAEGNPFYIEELIKMLIEDGVIQKGEEYWQVDASRLAGVRVPPTLAGVLQARFDSLPADMRLLLQRAAVIGRIFWDHALSYLSNNTPTTIPSLQTANGDVLHAALEDLSTRDMVFRRAESAFENTTEYLFRHTLLRDVTYESMLKRDRRIYHAHAARWLEAVTQSSQRADQYAALIAEHYEQAGETEQAGRWYERAGFHAAATYANAEALQTLSRALDLMPAGDLPRRIELILAREKVFHLVADRAAQTADLHSLAQLIEQLDPAEPRLLRYKTELNLRQSEYAEATGDYPGAIKAAQTAIELAMQAGADDLAATGYLGWGIILYRQADYPAARTILEEALELGRKCDLPVIQATSLRSLGIIAEALADYQQASEYFTESWAIFTRLGHRRGESACMNDLGVVSICQEDFTEARKYFERSLKIKHEIGDRRGIGSVLNNLGVVAYNQHDFIASRDFYQRELELSREIDDTEGIATSYAGLGSNAMILGQYEQAKNLLLEAAQMFHAMNDDQGESGAFTNLTNLHFQLGQYDEALSYTEQAVKLARSAGLQLELGAALASQGRALLGACRLEEARQVLQEALSIQQELNHTGQVLDAQVSLAQAALLAGDSGLARQLVEAILQEFDKHRQDPQQAMQGVDSPAIVYNSLGHVLRALGDPRLEAVMEQGRRLIEQQTQRLDDPELRRSFREDVPPNQALLTWQDSQEGTVPMADCLSSKGKVQ